MSVKQDLADGGGCLVFLVTALGCGAGLASGAGLLAAIGWAMVAFVGSVVAVAAVLAAIGDGRGPRAGT